MEHNIMEHNIVEHNIVEHNIVEHNIVEHLFSYWKSKNLPAKRKETKKK